MKKRDVNLSTNKFIIVTGLTRSGKTALVPIISSMKNTEQYFFNTTVENLTTYNFLKLINDQIATSLIVHTLNEEIFDKIYGRNLNNKKFDLTNIKKYRGEVDYQKRILTKKSNFFTKKILKKYFSDFIS